MNTTRTLLFGILFCVVLLASCAVPAAHSGSVLWLTADREVDQVMEDYLQRGIEAGQEQNDAVIVIELNTPGGEIDQMEQIVTSIQQSHVPVVVFVSPRGAMAGSAGTIITLAGHLSAMAPDTAIGAASPVGSQGQDLGTTLQTKEKEILKALVRSLVAHRPPEAIALAESTIDEAKAVSAEEARQAGLVDIVATDRHDLLQQLDGRIAITAYGQIPLHTSGAPVEEFPLALSEILLQLFINPNILFLLMVVGVGAIFIELSHPGIWFPGFLGAVCIAMALYGMGIISVNWFGLAFIALAFLLFFLELQNPTHGMMAVAGLASFIIGTLVLFNTNSDPFSQHVSLPLVIGVGVVMLAGILFVITLALRTRNLPPVYNLGRFKGVSGIVKSALAPRGTVQAGGELWTAESENHEDIAEGATVEVVRVEGTRLVVRKQS